MAKKTDSLSKVLMTSRFSLFLVSSKKLTHKIKSRFTKLISAHPFISFLFLLVGLLILIIAGNQLRKPVLTAESNNIAKKVSTFQLSANPTLKVQAKIEKSGLIKLVAQTSGVVQSIKVSEGDEVNRGSSIVSLSTNYQGASAPRVQTQLTQKNYQFLTDTFQAQLDTIRLNRELAKNTETQQAELREIGRKSINETKSLISLNEEIVRGLDSQISQLEVLNVNGSSDSAILSIKASKSQTVAALNGLRSGLRATEYTTSDDQEPAKAAQLVRDATLKQLDIQEKSLTLNKEVAQLNVRLAKIQESLLFPVSPCDGVVERVHVTVGQVVNPGTLLATIKADDNAATAVIHVTADVARSMSLFQAAEFTVGSNTVAVTPRHISSEPTENGLNTAVFSLPEEVAYLVADGTYIPASIQVGLSQLAANANVFIPLDTVYQNGDSAYVYVAEEAEQGFYKVVSKKIKVGQVFGSFIELLDGLSTGEQVIVTRSVLPEDRVTINNSI